MQEQLLSNTFKQYKFDCGCSFKVHNEKPKLNDGLPSISIDYENITLDCPITWKVFHDGHTKGVFQLEKQLGQTWSKRIAPSNLLELSAVIALIRPGCLKAFENEKNMTQHYSDRKNGVEPVTYFHPGLESILKDTYNILVYQEQSMRIATDLVGFNLQEADTLRKAMGKKDAALMTKVGESFKIKAKEKGILSENEANTIFEWIQASNRYSFNLSHSAEYGMLGYWTAYGKAHFPLHFYVAWLYYAKDKQEPQEEIEELVEDLESKDFQICPPTLKYYNDLCNGFSLIDDKIYFGISDIKGIGSSVLNSLKTRIKELEDVVGKKIENIDWWTFLTRFSQNFTTKTINNLIAVGATDYMNSSDGASLARSGKIFEYNIWSELNEREQQYCVQSGCKTILESLFTLLGANKIKIVVSRQKKIQELIAVANGAAYSIKDTHYQIVTAEEEFLGVPITCRRLDNCYTQANTKCKELVDGKGGNVSIAVEIVGLRKHKIKSGKSKGNIMAFLKVKDDTGVFNSVTAFSNKWEEFSDLLYRKNTVLISGKASLRNGENGLIIDKVEQI